MSSLRPDHIDNMTLLLNLNPKVAIPYSIHPGWCVSFGGFKFPFRNPKLKHKIAFTFYVQIP